jgi:hypothetical protein
MSVVKVIEVIAQSSKSFEDATQAAITEAGKTVKGIKSIWIENLSAEVEENRIVSYRVNGKISFVLQR